MDTAFVLPDGELFIDRPELRVWVKRPNANHQNWWICFASPEPDVVRTWNLAVPQLYRQYELGWPFHQGTWPLPQHHAECRAIFHDGCVNTVHGWELGSGCGRFALAFPDASLEDLVECGDEALMLALAALPVIEEEAGRRVAELRA